MRTRAATQGPRPSQLGRILRASPRLEDGRSWGSTANIRSAAALLLIGVFGVDLASPADVCAEMLYPAAVLVTVLLPQRSEAIVAACAASGLLIFAHIDPASWSRSPTFASTTDLVNCGLALGLLWVVTTAGLEWRSREARRATGWRGGEAVPPPAPVEPEREKDEELFRLATEALNGIVYDWSPKSGKVERSMGLSEMTGHRPEEVEASSDWWEAQMHPEDYVESRRLVLSAIAAGAPSFKSEYRVRHKDGHYVWVLDHGRLRYDETGQLSRVVGCTISIDDRRRAEEELREAHRRKDEFLAILAHELRNPMAPIRNAVELLSSPLRTSEQEEWCSGVIRRQVGQLARLVDDLIDVSRLSQGKMALDKQPIALETIIQRAVETSQPLVTARRHALSIELPTQPVWIHGDLTRLAQVVSNLLNNAAKYTPPGGSICVRAEVAASEVAIHVVDTGVGIPAHMLSSIFELFTQVGRSPEDGGLGIGLALVKRLVDLHGGRVQAHSDGARGSEFVLTLPTHALDPRGAQDARRETAERRAPLRLLIIDDNRDAAQSLAMLLGNGGHHATAVFDGATALTTADTLQPDAVICDIGMPGMSGLEVARRLRARFGVRPLLIAMSGYGQADDQARSLAAGFDQHLVKPIDLEVLEDLLQERVPLEA